MSDFNERSITDAVLQRIADTPDPRLHEIMRSLVTHLHAFVREARPTLAEWRQGVDYLTRTGQICDDKRQEFILLSDALGVSMLVDAINHAHGPEHTESTVLGPFYVEGPPEFVNGADLSPGLEGQALFVDGAVRDEAGRALRDVIVDVWHSDDEGFYDVQHQGRDDAIMRGRLRTNEQGRFWFWTIMPRFYPIPHDGPVGDMLKATARHPYRPAHVHFKLAAPGLAAPLVTHVFAAGDPYLESDAVFAVKNSLIRTFETMPPGEWAGRRLEAPWRRVRFEFVLPSVQG